MSCHHRQVFGHQAYLWRHRPRPLKQPDAMVYLVEDEKAICGGIIPEAVNNSPPFFLEFFPDGLNQLKFVAASPFHGGLLRGKQLKLTQKPG